MPKIKKVTKPKTKKEIADEKILGQPNGDLKWYMELPIDYRSRYVGRGHILTDEQFNYLMDNPTLDR